MSRLIFITMAVLVLSPLYLGAETKAVQTPDVPYKNAMDALKVQDFEDAISWFDVIDKDFQNSKESRIAGIMKVSMLLGQELASLKVVNLFNDSLKWITGKDKKNKSKEISEVIENYEERAHEAANGMLKEMNSILKKTDSKKPRKIKASFVINTKGWDVSDLRDSVQKGKMLEDKELDDLYLGEFLANFLGFISEVVPMEGVRLLDGAVNGEVDVIKLFRLVGERFLINAKNRGPNSNFTKAAKESFKRVISLTENNPYGKERHLASRGLSELEALEKGYESFTRCSKCSRLMDPDWKFCPYDGSRIKKKKK